MLSTLSCEVLYDFRAAATELAQEGSGGDSTFPRSRGGSPLQLQTRFTLKVL